MPAVKDGGENRLGESRMADEFFLNRLENVIARMRSEAPRLWEVRHLRNDPGLPALIYVVESEAGQRFLLGRETCGRPKFNMIRYIAKSFVEVFFEQLKGKKVSQYLILRGAYPFDLQYAMGIAPPRTIGFFCPPPSSNSNGFSIGKAPIGRSVARALIGEYQGDTWLDSGYGHRLRLNPCLLFENRVCSPSAETGLRLYGLRKSGGNSTHLPGMPEKRGGTDPCLLPVYL